MLVDQILYHIFAMLRGNATLINFVIILILPTISSDHTPKKWLMLLAPILDFHVDLGAFRNGAKRYWTIQKC